MTTWYLAICVQCNGNLRDLIDHPENFMPMPFDNKDVRTSWTDAHMGGTGHSILLMNQHETEQ